MARRRGANIGLPRRWPWSLCLRRSRIIEIKFGKWLSIKTSEIRGKEVYLFRIFFGKKGRETSDVDIQTFCCKKLRFFVHHVVNMNKRAEKIRTFFGQGEMWSIFLQFCVESFMKILEQFLISVSRSGFSQFFDLGVNSRSRVWKILNVHILKANLSWTRKTSNSRDAKKFSVCVYIFLFFALQARLQILKFEFCQILLE